MKSFAQRDFVKSDVCRQPAEPDNSIPVKIGRFIVLCLSTTGLFFSMAFMWMAHQ